jgi:ATP-dependent DNA ligase
MTPLSSHLALEPRGTSPLPKTLAPMLMHKADTLVRLPDWTYEPKWDGFRVIATVKDAAVRLLSRNGHSFTDLFRPVTDALRGFPVSVVLDGEVICVTDDGRADFEALQQRLRPRDGKVPGHVCYMVFDCLYVNGHSLLGRPLEDRQRIFHELGPAFITDAVKLTEAFPAAQSRRLMDACVQMGLEGVVMKRKGSLYRPGYRSPDWIKVPIRHTDEFVVAGYLAASPDRFSSLILGQYDKRGKLAYAGLVGTGLSEDTRRAMFLQLQAAPRKSAHLLWSPCSGTTSKSFEPMFHPSGCDRYLSCRWHIGSVPRKDCATRHSRGFPESFPRCRPFNASTQAPQSTDAVPTASPLRRPRARRSRFRCRLVSVPPQCPTRSRR